MQASKLNKLLVLGESVDQNEPKRDIDVNHSTLEVPKAETAPISARFIRVLVQPSTHNRAAKQSSEVSDLGIRYGSLDIILRSKDLSGVEAQMWDQIPQVP